MKKSLISYMAVAAVLGSTVPFSNAGPPPPPPLPPAKEKSSEETTTKPPTPQKGTSPSTSRKFVELGLEALKLGEENAPNSEIGTYIAAGIVLTKGAIAGLELGVQIYNELGPPLKVALTKVGEALTTTTQEVSQAVGDSHLTMALGDKDGRLLAALVFDVYASPYQRNLYTAYAVDPNDPKKQYVVSRGRVQMAFTKEDRNQVQCSFIEGTVRGYAPSFLRAAPWLTFTFPLAALQSSGADANGTPSTFIKGFTNVGTTVKGVKHTLYAPLVKAATISYATNEGPTRTSGKEPFTMSPVEKPVMTEGPNMPEKRPTTSQ